MLLKKKLHSYFLLTSIFYILCYIVITPPFYVADEQAHFQKVASKENFFIFHKINVDSGVKNFTKYYFDISEIKHIKNRDYKYSLNHFDELGSEFIFSGQFEKAKIDNMQGYPITGYIFSKIGFKISKIFTDSVIYSFYLARLFNFLLTVFISYFVIKNISKGKEYLFSICSLPMSLSLIGSCSQDAMIFVYTLIIVLISYNLLNKLIVRLIVNEIFIVVINIFCFFVILARPTYTSFMLLPLFFIFNNSNNKTFQIFIFSIFLILSFIFINHYPTLPKTNVISIPQDLFFIFKLIVLDIYENSAKYLVMMVAGLGKIDIFPSKLILLLLLVSISTIFFNFLNFKNIFNPFNLLIISICLLTLAATQLGQYMYFTDTGRTNYIQGVQGRYFIPCFMLLTLCLNFRKKKTNTLINKSISYILFIFPHFNFFIILKFYNFFY